jgi:hypothetical protein
MNGCSAGSSLVLLTVGDLNFPALTMRMAFVILRSMSGIPGWHLGARHLRPLPSRPGSAALRPLGMGKNLDSLPQAS